MTGPRPTPPGCGAHASLGAELRAVAVLALDRLGPALERAREGGPGTPSSCSGCPVCAVLALLRGERPELAVRLAEHAAGLLAVVQAALDDGEDRAAGEGASDPGPGQDGAGPDGAGRPPARRVQRIPVDRPAPAAR